MTSPTDPAGLCGECGTPDGSKKYVSLLDFDRCRLSILNNLENDVTLDLVEKFLALIYVVISPGVRPANHHHNQIPIKNALIAHRRLQKVLILLDPSGEVYGCQFLHGPIRTNNRIL